MIRHNSFAALALACSGLALFCLGAWAFTQEGATYLRVAGTPLAAVNLRSETDPVGLGIVTRRDVLEDCEVTLRSAKSFELMVLPAMDFDTLRAKCAAIAQSIAITAPTFSLAWAVAAQAATLEHDWAKMNRYLAASQMSGPNQHWIGAIRFEIADANFDRLNEDARALYDRDLQMLIQSHKGIAYIARQYVLDISFRSRIVAVLASMNEADQRRYLAVLRQMVQH